MAEETRYVGHMRFADGSSILFDQDRIAVIAMRDVLLSYGVTWDGRMTHDEVESMYLGLLVGFGDDICE